MQFGIGLCLALIGALTIIDGVKAQTVLPPVVVSEPEAPPKQTSPVKAATTRPPAIEREAPTQASASPQPPAATAPPPLPQASSSSIWPASPDAVRGLTALVDIAASASAGIVGQDRLEAQSPFRPAEILEAVPGLVVTQHSGEGKANQYFLRGLNLDHGTDIAIFFDGMPVNMPSHGHGQGYADANFMIPELLRSLSFKKGPYYADEGNFASAGAVHVDYVDKLARNFGQIEVGSFGFRRALAAASAPSNMGGNTLVAAAIQSYDGPWARPDDLHKATGVIRYSQGSRENGWALTGMGYSARWFSTDQIPQRAVGSGVIGRFGNLDDTAGGSSSRFSLSGRWAQMDGDTSTFVSAYAIRSQLDLFSNFTYFLENSTDGDQFHQQDARTVAGGRVAGIYRGMVLEGVKAETEFGLQFRHDDIRNGLFKTRAREQLSTVRHDRISETTAGLYGQSTLRWTPWLRTIAGLRADWHQGQVDSNLAANTGAASDMIASPKLGLVFGPWARTEFYLSGGFGHHSNDLRGATSTIDPADGVTALQRSPLLVRSKGAEIGVRSEGLPGLQLTGAMFLLDYDSEIVFVGDAGTTEASRPSRRLGWEFNALYNILTWLKLEVEYASTRARFTVDDPGAPGRHIPGAVEGVAKIGLRFESPDGWFGGLSWRYFGPRPLIEDNTVRSKATAPLSAQLGYKLSDTLVARLDGYNLLNQRASQIDYFYQSRLRHEAGGVGDVHFHPLEPTSVRLTLTALF